MIVLLAIFVLAVIGAPLFVIIGAAAAGAGHPYRARIDFTTGRYAFCKIRGRPGELAVRAPRVRIPSVCGG